MKSLVGDRLPNFSIDEIKLLNGSIDFLGLNHYTSVYVKNGKSNGIGWISDKNTVESFLSKNGIPIGPVAQSSWLHVYPKGLRKLLQEINTTYGNVEIWITENGVDEPGENNKIELQSHKDYFRLNYLKSYINELYQSITVDKLNIKAYFIWSLLDNFEWAEGFVSRFGIYHVNYNDQKRTIKLSGEWYKNKVVKCNPDYSSFMITLFGIICTLFALFLLGAVIYIFATRKEDQDSFQRV